jgi:TonB family protein
VKSAFACEFPESTKVIINQCQAAIGGRVSPILCSSAVEVPITVGVIRRIIILPAHFAGTVGDDVLRSAIGHELVHIERRDYLMNLVYEFIYLPISFHPAAAVARRRIKQTRELCCDETVVAKLIKPETYARSLISLIGSSPPWRKMAADTTIGMNESDILEVRIMSLLRTPKFTTRRRTVLLIAASLLLLTPCIAAARFAPRFQTKQQEQNRDGLEKQQADQRELLEKVSALRQQARALKEKMEQAPEPQRAEIESRLREVQQNLELHARAVEEFKEKTQNEDALKLRELLEVYEKSRPADQAKITELREQIALAETAWSSEKLVAELKMKMEDTEKLSSQNRKARLIYHIEPEYTADAREKKIEGSVWLAFTIDRQGVPQGIQIKKSLYPSLDQAAVNAVSTWRFEPAVKNGEPVSMWVESEVVFRLDYNQSPEERARRAKEELEKARAEGKEPRLLRVEEKIRVEQEARRMSSAELTRQAKISMDQAIQIATSKVPGKVLECRLIGERWESKPGEPPKPGLVLYRVLIVSGDESNPTMQHVFIDAGDGSVFKVEQELLRSENPEVSFDKTKAIEGGVLNGRALALPLPQYPSIARAAKAEGQVLVRIMINEGGHVIWAKAISGHPLLQSAAVDAAREAKFEPTRRNGVAVMVTGTLTYNFVTY